MRVRVRLFARLRDIVTVGEIVRDAPEGATPRTVWDALAAEHAELARYTGVISCAVNEEYSRFDTPLSDNDEVAYLPPVSGGRGVSWRRLSAR